MDSPERAHPDAPSVAEPTAAAAPPAQGPETAERFAGHMARHHTALMGFILSLVPNWTDAEDLLQQTSVVLWRRFGEFRSGSDFMAWACQVARYHVLNHRRQRSRDRHLFSDEVLDIMAEEAVTHAEELDSERHALGGCLEKLDPKSRRLLGRCYEPGTAVTRVAEELGRTPNSVYKELNRIRDALLRCIRRTLAGGGA
jgi:RNA polymerase sigma-70 factor (ECF subfamily)